MTGNAYRVVDLPVSYLQWRLKPPTAATRIVHLFKADRERIRENSNRAGSVLLIHEQFQRSPYLTANQLAERTGLSIPKVNGALVELMHLAVLDEITGKRRGHVFAYRQYLTILSEGTDPCTAIAILSPESLPFIKKLPFIEAVGLRHAGPATAVLIWFSL